MFRTLTGQLVSLQIALTAATCLLLVAGTFLAVGWVILHSQEAALSALADSICEGIAKERSEGYVKGGLAEIAKHYFEESRIRGFHIEFRDPAGRLLTEEGSFPGLPVTDLVDTDPPACDSMRWTDRNEAEVTLRGCVASCFDGHRVAVATSDALRDGRLRRTAIILLLIFPITQLIGAVAGRFVLGKLLRPLQQLRDSARRVSPGGEMALGVAARTEELAQLERAFDDLLQRLAAILDRERRFAQEASHELRTPMTKLRLRLEQLRRRIDAGSDRSNLAQVDAALADLDALDRLTDGLLNLTRSESEMPVGPVNVCDLIRDLASRDAIHGTASPRRIEIEAPDEILVRGSEILLKQALENVVDNARKYAGEHARIRIRAQSRDGGGMLSVEDDGPGIPDEIRPRVFERFYRGPLTRHQVPGTGLGLSLVDAIAHRHEGWVETGPSPIGGERVRLWIPLVADGSPPRPPDRQ